MHSESARHSSKARRCSEQEEDMRGGKGTGGRRKRAADTCCALSIGGKGDALQLCSTAFMSFRSPFTRGANTLGKHAFFIVLVLGIIAAISLLSFKKPFAEPF
ncbi:hypothetical protein AB1Y20_014298 [Prymnesium parvum]|uniref:Transmembrane protein n=1 Tax=Prymnesium parvum TaxID=97485 RepID=A0AB34IDB3_PRYPA